MGAGDPTAGRGRSAVAAVVGLATAAAVGLAPAADAAAGPCPDADGVTVVVDFRDLGGDTVVACASGPVEDGFDALRTAGIDYESPVRYPGMICRIEARPADEPCQGAPPADAYWAYWHAQDDDWTYSEKGPAARTPPPGSAEGWSFTTDPDDPEGSPPRTAPTTHDPAPAASDEPGPSEEPSPPPASPTPAVSDTPPPDPPPSAAATPVPAAATPGGTPSPAPSTPSPGTTDAAPPASGSGAVDRTAPATGSASEPTPTPTAGARTPGAGARTAAAEPERSGGGIPTGTWAGGLLVAVLGVAAWLRSRRDGGGP